MQGYHNRPEETARVLTSDRGLKTGDLGRLDSDGYLYITGRIKEQYKLENGKYVVPTQLEERLKLSPYISNVMVYGENRPHNVALVVINEDTVRSWGKTRGHSLRNVAGDPAVRELILDEIARFSSEFRGYERPQNCALISEDFTVENGMLTQSLKLKRRAVLERYRPLLDALYRTAA
jgi:long-chain acyl-CoA synthetase